jgi:hypothetical protein
METPYGAGPCIVAYDGWNCTRRTASRSATRATSARAKYVFPVPGGPYGTICERSRHNSMSCVSHDRSMCSRMASSSVAAVRVGTVLTTGVACDARHRIAGGRQALGAASEGAWSS